MRLQRRVDGLRTWNSLPPRDDDAHLTNQHDYQNYSVPLEHFPVFKRKGSIIPLHVFDSITGVLHPALLLGGPPGSQGNQGMEINGRRAS